MDDLISRQAAIEAISELATFTNECSEHTWMYTDDVYKTIKQLPPAQPKRGKWILAKEQRQEDTENGNYMYNCSNCDCGDLHSKAVKVSYCWNCGAKMEATT